MGTKLIKGPLGGHFIWDTTMPGPLVLLPEDRYQPLMSMLREHILPLDHNSKRNKVACRIFAKTGTPIDQRAHQRQNPYFQELEYAKNATPILKSITPLPKCLKLGVVLLAE